MREREEEEPRVKRIIKKKRERERGKRGKREERERERREQREEEYTLSSMQSDQCIGKSPDTSNLSPASDSLATTLISSPMILLLKKGGKDKERKERDAWITTRSERTRTTRGRVHTKWYSFRISHVVVRAKVAKHYVTIGDRVHLHIQVLRALLKEKWKRKRKNVNNVA